MMDVHTEASLATRAIEGHFCLCRTADNFHLYALRWATEDTNADLPD